MDASKTYIGESFGGCDKISLLELAKLQAKVLVPMIRALSGVPRASPSCQSEFGVRSRPGKYPIASGPPD
jgi:hypothetical protein